MALDVYITGTSPNFTVAPCNPVVYWGQTITFHAPPSTSITIWSPSGALYPAYFTVGAGGTADAVVQEVTPDTSHVYTASPPPGGGLPAVCNPHPALYVKRAQRLEQGPEQPRRESRLAEKASGSGKEGPVYRTHPVEVTADRDSGECIVRKGHEKINARIGDSIELTAKGTSVLAKFQGPEFQGMAPLAVYDGETQSFRLPITLMAGGSCYLFLYCSGSEDFAACWSDKTSKPAHTHVVINVVG